MLQTISRKILSRLSGRFRKRPVDPAAVYDEYWKTSRGCYGERFVPDVCKLWDFQTVLDAGSGEGVSVRRFLEHGKEARGIEVSAHAIEQHTPDLAKAGIVQCGTLTQLPFSDNSFDVVFSSEVMEHLVEEDVAPAVRELVRVAKRYLFLTISLRPSSNFNKYHPTLRPRAWWESHFLKAGTVKLADVVQRFQRVLPGATNEEVLLSGPTRTHIHEMTEFARNPPYPLHGELEPWFFAFEKKRKVRS